MNDLTLTSVVSQKVDLLSSPLDDEVVLFDTDRGSYFAMNPVAAEIWRIIEVPTSILDIKIELTKRFDVTDDQCEREVLAFLSALKEKNLIDIQ